MRKYALLWSVRSYTSEAVQVGSGRTNVESADSTPCCTQEASDMAVEKSMASTSLAEVVDRILDKGVVVDAWIRVSLVGIELLAIEARVVVAGVDTYLKYAEAVGLTAAAPAA